MEDVINRSIICHPTLFAADMRNTARIHDAHAVQTQDRRSANIARGMASQLRAMATMIERTDSLEPGELTFGAKIMAFNVACGLQLIPRHTRTAIAVREDEKTSQSRK
jgi:hypothetical protein